MKKLALIIISLIVVMGTACSQQGKNQVTDISADSLKASMNQTDIVILDVRTPEEFADGHVEGAVNIDFKNADFSANIDKLDKTKKYEVYCRSGHRSAESAKVMNGKGFNVSNVTGGILGWQEKGYPVVQ